MLWKWIVVFAENCSNYDKLKDEWRELDVISFGVWLKSICVWNYNIWLRSIRYIKGDNFGYLKDLVEKIIMEE